MLIELLEWNMYQAVGYSMDMSVCKIKFQKQMSTFILKIINFGRTKCVLSDLSFKKKKRKKKLRKGRIIVKW